MQVVPASSLPACSSFDMYQKQPESFEADYILWGSQEQFAGACDKLREDQADLVEFLGTAITQDDLLQGATTL